MKKIRLSHPKKYHTLSILFHFWRKKGENSDEMDKNNKTGNPSIQCSSYQSQSVCYPRFKGIIYTLLLHYYLITFTRLPLE